MAYFVLLWNPVTNSGGGKNMTEILKGKTILVVDDEKDILEDVLTMGHRETWSQVFKRLQEFFNDTFGADWNKDIIETGPFIAMDCVLPIPSNPAIITCRKLQTNGPC